MGKPFDLLQMLLEAARETGEECIAAIRTAPAADQDFVFEASVRLHARACLLASEVLWMMYGGYASGGSGALEDSMKS